MYATIRDFEMDMRARTWREDFEAMCVEGLLDGMTVEETLDGDEEEDTDGEDEAN